MLSALRPAVSLAHNALPRRPFVSVSLLRVLERVPALCTARNAFSFQAFAECLPHTSEMLERTVGQLAKDGVIERSPPSPLRRSIRVLGRSELPKIALLGIARDAKVLHEKNAAAGPLQLIGPGSLQPGQGEREYAQFHSTMLVASLHHRGREIGILVDGNDQQDNPTLRALRAWQKQSGDTRSLDQLSVADFEAFNQAHPDLDLYQCAFRVVDLADMLASSERASTRSSFTLGDESSPFFPVSFDDSTTVLAFPETEVLKPLIAPDHAQALEAALQAEPGSIERFPEKQGDPRARRYPGP